MEMKRGQSALEYLVTYGWAILAIVIIAGILWYFGIFNPGKFAGEKQCGGFSAFICQDFKVNTSGWVQIVLNNKVGGTINAVNITSGSGNSASLGGWGCPTTGATATATANANATCIARVQPIGQTSGDLFDQLTITLSYTDARSGISHTDAGFIRGKYE